MTSRHAVFKTVFATFISLITAASVHAQSGGLSELEVDQISSEAQATAQPNGLLEINTLPSPLQELNAVAPSLLDRLPTNQRGNSARIEQAGSLNTSSLIVKGQGNNTLQLQTGIANSSRLIVRGERNRVAVDQDGRRLSSDVSLGTMRTGAASGETLVHIQRGRGNLVTSQPVPTAGMDGTPRIVVDTNMGRKIFSVPGGIGARPVEVESSVRPGS